MENITILVIEDNELNMKLVRGILITNKYRVIEAVDAETGIQLTREHHPDLILMDIQLPGMDGLEATRIVKADPALNDIPVLALTSYAMQGDEEKAIAAGCDGYLSKPIDLQHFLETIGRFLSDREARSPDRPGNNKVHKNKILIVDDDPLNIKLLAAKLPDEKYKTIEACNGAEAIEKALKESPDLILLDIMMPEMDGYEVTKRLKDNPATREIPIILITALDNRDDKVKGLEAGAEEFLNKPINTTELLARIQSMVRLKQYQEQLSIRSHSGQSFFIGSHQGEPGEDKELPLILLVENDQKDARLIGSYLSNQPYHVMFAGDGEETMTLVQEEKIDLILLDILLPGMDGFQVCERLKEVDDTKDIQILFITSLQDLESKIKGLEIGADDYLIKPIDERELRIRVKSLLKKKECLDGLVSLQKRTLDSVINDALTGLYNHTYFRRYLELELKRSLRQKYPLALTMIDIDDFELYNNRVGHHAGDIFLIEMARVLRENIREVDLLARYGGEKFAIAQPYTGRGEVSTVAERLHSAIREHPFHLEVYMSPPQMTVSMGVALCPSDATTPDSLIQKAETALSSAKKEGKNRFLLYNTAFEEIEHG